MGVIDIGGAKVVKWSFSSWVWEKLRREIERTRCRRRSLL